MSEPRIWIWEELADEQSLEHGTEFVLASDYDALKAQLAEVTRERDEVLKSVHTCDNCGYGHMKHEAVLLTEELIQPLNDALRAERAKAERFRGALEYIKTASKAQGFMFAHDEASKALTEAEGE